MISRKIPDARKTAPLLGALLGLSIGSLAIGHVAGGRHVALFLIGGLLGVTFFRASFGFAGAWRKLVLERRGAAIRSQFLMVALTSALILPGLWFLPTYGVRVGGAFAPIGVSLIVGATLFGFGMQLGGGCGSGTLFTVGGGNRKMVITLMAFIGGSTIGTIYLPWWISQPSLGTINLAGTVGPAATVIGTIALLALLAMLTMALERSRHGAIEPSKREDGPRLSLRGPLRPIEAAVIISVLNLATLIVAGHPWSITYGFGLWGAKMAAAVGFDVDNWLFWQLPTNARSLNATVLSEVTSIMDFGLILGAMVAAGAAGKFYPKTHLSLGSVSSAILGGLMMGFGARLSFGCNIGAFVGGIASGSLHGWVWFCCAFVGSLIAIWGGKFRYRALLLVTRSTDGSARG